MLALAAGLALGRCRASPERDWRPGRSLWAAADRDGGEIVTLDSDLYVTQRIAVPWPERVVPCSDGGYWVRSVPAGHARGARHLLAVGAQGEVRLDLEIGPPFELEAGDRKSALVGVQEESGAAELLVVELGGAVHRRPLPAGSTSIAFDGDARIAVSAGALGLWVLGLVEGPAEEFAGLPGRSVLDVVAAPDRGWWILACENPIGDCLLARLSASGELLGQIPCTRGALARTTLRSRAVWLVCHDEEQVFGWSGWHEEAPWVAKLSIPGAHGAAVDAQGGLLVATPGAVLRFDRKGETLPGQGGFQRLVDLARIELSQAP